MLISWFLNALVNKFLRAAIRRQSGETMTSVYAGHIILTPTRPDRAPGAGIKPRTSLQGVLRSTGCIMT